MPMTLKRKWILPNASKHIKKHQLPYIEFNVLIGKKAQIPSRLIIYPADQATYEKRVRKTQKQTKSCGHNVSDEFKTRAKMTLYITNTDPAIIPAANIKKVYGLRWQIELTFKIWKSQAKINQVKNMKMHRFECQLIAKLIWLLMHRTTYQCLPVRQAGITQQANYNGPEDTCSIWKYYKHAYRVNDTLRSTIIQPDKLYALVTQLTHIAEQLLILEIKKGKISHYEALITLT